MVALGCMLLFAEIQVLVFDLKENTKSIIKIIKIKNSNIAFCFCFFWKKKFFLLHSRTECSSRNKCERKLLSWMVLIRTQYCNDDSTDRNFFKMNRFSSLPLSMRHQIPLDLRICHRCDEEKQGVLYLQFLSSESDRAQYLRGLSSA